MIKRPLLSSQTSYLKKVTFSEFIHIFVVFRKRIFAQCCCFPPAVAFLEHSEQSDSCPGHKHRAVQIQAAKFNIMQFRAMRINDRHFPNLKFSLKCSRFPSNRQISCKQASFLCASVSRLKIKTRSRLQPLRAPKPSLSTPQSEVYTKT